MGATAGSLAAQIERFAPLLTTADVCDLRAAREPDAEALTDARQRLSWADVKERSDRLAAGLHRIGLVRGDRVLVQLPNVVELFLVRVACEKAGLPLVPVPATFRQAELAQILRLTRPAAAIAPAAGARVDYPAMLAAAAGAAGVMPKAVILGERVPPEALAYAEVADRPLDSAAAALLERTRFNAMERTQILTTSGSTGVPKCVEAASYARMLTGAVQAARFGVRADDTVAALTPLFAGTSDSLIYQAGPRYARRMVLMEHFDAQAACDLLEREGVAIATIVPTMLARLLQVEGLSPRRFPALRAFATYGAALPPDLGEKAERLTGARIVQAYGLTEYGGVAATPITDPPELRWQTVGPPLDGNEVRVVDDQGRDLPPGEVGRVWVRGLHAVGGFYGNSAMTADRWRSGFYDIQDLGYFGPQGRLALTGRQDDLIIRGGQNIYPQDIEHLLMRHPHVLEVAAVGMPDAEMGERICVYVVPRGEVRPSLNSLREFLRDQGVAGFKLPERLEIVDALPRAPAGTKVDKRLLAEDVRRKLIQSSSKTGGDA